jgi:hypothetical protein
MLKCLPRALLSRQMILFSVLLLGHSMSMRRLFVHFGRSPMILIMGTVVVPI